MNEFYMPDSMAERVLKARELFIKNPKESQVDDDMLVWCYCEDTGLWYSIAGNYSASSPNKKREIERKREETSDKWRLKMEKEAMKQYKERVYYSEIRRDVLERDYHTCQICKKMGNSSFHVHHILKRRHGGEDYLDNLITVCPSCHKQADTKLYNPNWK